MATKVLKKVQRVGFLIQPKASGVATAYKCAGGDENHWLNGAVAGSNFRTLFVDIDNIGYDFGVIVDKYNVNSQNGIYDEAERAKVDSITGLPSLSFSMPVDIYTIAPLLAATYHGISEAGTGNFRKTITGGGISGLIDFNGNSGQLISIAIDMKGSADDGLLLQNGIISSSNLIIDMNSQGVARRATYNFTVVGRMLLSKQTLNGTWVKHTPYYLNDTDVFAINNLTINSIDYASEVCRRFEQSYNARVQVNARGSGGYPEQFDIMPEITSKISLDYNSTTEQIVKDYIDGRSVSLILNNNISSDTLKEFSITLPYGLLVEQPIAPYNEFLGVDLNCRHYSNAGATPITIYVTDAQDMGY